MPGFMDLINFYFRIFNFFKQDFWWLVLIQFVFGLVLGIVPSFIAIKKYLEI